MQKRQSLTGTILLLLSLLAALATVIMMFGARLGLWEPIVGFGYYRQYATILAYVVCGLSVTGLLVMLADDVVVRVSADEEGSRIDVRSVSRIGRGDRGVNAARIKAFSEAF